MRRAEQMTPTEIALVGRVLDPGNGQMNSLRISQLDDEEWRTLKGLIMAGDLKVEAPYVQLATTITGLMNAGWFPLVGNYGNRQHTAEEWSNDPDDGHDHDFTDDVADLPDTGTDATPVICTKCGMLSAQ